MCVGLPARVLTMKDGMAVVDASGAKREISAQLLEELEPGDYENVFDTDRGAYGGFDRVDAAFHLDENGEMQMPEGGFGGGHRGGGMRRQQTTEESFAN